MARHDIDVLVGLGDIAEIAGVSRAAVSNWRKRKEDFPEPRLKTAAGSMFDLGEVEEWLLANEKIDRPVSPQDILWRLGDALRGEWSAEQVWEFVLSSLVYLVACDRSADSDPIATDDCWSTIKAEHDDHLLARLEEAARRFEQGDHRLEDLLVPGFIQQPAPDPQVARAILNALAGVLSEDETRGVEFFHEAESRLYSYDRFAGAHSTPDAVAYLLVRLLEPLGDTVVDPAVGLGGLLLMAALASAEPPRRLYGFDVDGDVLRYARAWMYIYDVDAHLELQDALRFGVGQRPSTAQHPLAGVADTVILDAPFGLSKWGDAELYAEECWRWGAPPPSSADLAWPQVALDLLAPSGRAAVVLPPGAAFRGGREGAIRQRLVGDGLVEAVVDLPPRLRRETSTPVSVWLLRRTPVESDNRVLLVDATALGKPGRAQHDFDESAIDRITDLLHHWRKHGQIRDADGSIAIALAFNDLHDANLVPGRHLIPEFEFDVDSLRDELAGLRDALGASVHVDVPEGPVPDVPLAGLDRVRLDEVARLFRGSARLSDHVTKPDGGIRVINARDIIDPTRAPRYVTPQDAQDLSTLAAGDLVVALSGDSASPAAVGSKWDGAVLGRHCLAVRPTDDRISAAWLAAWATTSDYRSQMAAFAVGAVATTVRVRDLGALQVPIAQEPVRSELLRRLDAYERAIAETATALERLRRMREIEMTIHLAPIDGHTDQGEA